MGSLSHIHGFPHPRVPSHMHGSWYPRVLTSMGSLIHGISLTSMGSHIHGFSLSDPWVPTTTGSLSHIHRFSLTSTGSLSHIHGFSLPAQSQPKEGFSNFSKLLLLHVRLADSLNRFISLRIKSAFCSNPHNKALFISYYVAVYCSWRGFFGFVIITSILKSDISLIVLKSFVLDFSISFFRRILFMCNWRISSLRITKEVTPYLCFRNWWRRKRGGGGYSQAFKSAQWA